MDRKSWSLQYIFDIVTDHLLAQNAKSYIADFCAYRGDDGLKCAAGFLIPDEDYSPYMEGKYVTQCAYFCNNFTSAQIKLIRALQQIHDGSISLWKSRFSEIAADFNLNFDPNKNNSLPKSLTT